MNKPAPDQQTAAIEARLFKDTSAYQDIMDLPRPVSKHHWPLPAADHAGQFAPFAALTGYHQLINEVAERYSHKNYPDELSTKRIERKLLAIKPLLPLRLKVEYFNGDSGYYETLAGTATQLDFRRGRLMLTRKQEWELIIANLRKVTVVTRK